MRLCIIAFAAYGAFASAQAFAESPESVIHVGVAGDVENPGLSEVRALSRLADVALAARVDSHAYILGAAWLRPTLLAEQTQMRAGLVFELDAIRRSAAGAGQDELAKSAETLRASLEAMPVTGRRIATALDPYRLEVTPEENWVVADGDALFYPRRPSGVRVVGAVRAPCVLSFQALQDARQYLKECPLERFADRNVIYVVQPDGSVFQQNIALWNRDDARVLAPGAWIYVPFSGRIAGKATDASFNSDIANFLATQLLDDETLK